MKLKNAARYFDNDTVTDAYTGAVLFKAQFSGFEASAPDGSFNRRRTVSVAPEVVPADRRAVVVQGSTWIMGEFVTDGFKDRAVRKSTSAKEATDLFTILTPGQAALRDVTGVAQAYGHRDYLKDTVNSNTDSSYNPQYEVFFSITESLPEGYMLRSDKVFLNIRSINLANEGYWVGVSDQLAALPDPRSCEVNITVAGSFDPVTETYGPGTATTAILVDMYKLYNLQTAADERNKSGDMSLIVAKSSLTPVAGQEITIGTVKWRNLSFTDHMDAWNIHVRRS